MRRAAIRKYSSNVGARALRHCNRAVAPQYAKHHGNGKHRQAREQGDRRMTPEFSRRVPLDSIGSAPRSVEISATPDERAALAARFGLTALDRLDATATLAATAAAGVAVTGRMRADVVQSCVVSGESVAAQIDEPFALRFVEPASSGTDTEEIELSDYDCDMIDIDSNAVDLGEAVAQTLGLALDPFPRSAAEQARDAERKWVAGEDVGPFAGLKGLFKP
jgi:uncharacterized metal-binding protein YceD (DUF177 family)